MAMTNEEMIRRWPTGEGHFEGDDEAFHRELGSYDGEPTFEHEKAPARDPESLTNAEKESPEDFYKRLQGMADKLPMRFGAFVLSLANMKPGERMELVGRIQLFALKMSILNALEKVMNGGEYDPTGTPSVTQNKRGGGKQGVVMKRVCEEVQMDNGYDFFGIILFGIIIGVVAAVIVIGPMIIYNLVTDGTCM